MAGAQPNFYLWGSWKEKIIKEPFLTKKVSGPLKKVVLGSTFILALKEKGQVVAWGYDGEPDSKSNPNKGCLGLDPKRNPHTRKMDYQQADQPEELKDLRNVADIQMGDHHVVARTNIGEVYCWGNNRKGQCGLGEAVAGKEPEQHLMKPTKVEAIANEQVVEIAVVKNSTFALTIKGDVWAWGDNPSNILGLDVPDGQVEKPRKLNLLGDSKVRKIEVYEGRTIIAYVRTDTDDDQQDDMDDRNTDGERNALSKSMFEGIDRMRKTMENTQEWWNHLLSIKYGQPYDVPRDPVEQTAGGTIMDDLNVDIDKLQAAERHLNALLDAAIRELKDTPDLPGTRNVKFIICMFIDECRLRREKVQRTISARQIADAKRHVKELSGPVVIDFGSKNEDIRKIIATTKDLQQVLDIVNHIHTVDVMTRELQATLVECLQCKLELYDTKVELLKISEGKAADPMLPALRLIKSRWNTLKHFSLYQLYQECEAKRQQFKSDQEHLQHLVDESNRAIDSFLQIDKDRSISQDVLVPSLCYDLLRENAELRKMTNSYQLHVLMIHHDRNVGETSYFGQQAIGSASIDS